MSTPILECRNLSSGYGPITVLRDVNISVNPGEVVALLGPNGAGKTTTLLTLVGELKPLGGSVHLFGEEANSSMQARCANGVSYITEERSVIMSLTAGENLRLAGVEATKACELFPPLERLLGRRAGLLSGGEQQMLTLARAICRDPKVILADELSLGLAPIIVQGLLATLKQTAVEKGVGVLLVEQHITQALDIADRIYVMQRGKVVLTGPAKDVSASDIENAYLSAKD